MAKQNSSVSYANSINSLLEKFNNILKKLLDKTNNTIDINTFLLLKNVFKEFIQIIQKSIFPLIFSFINDNPVLETKLSTDFTNIKFMILKLLEKIEYQFNYIEENLSSDTKEIDFTKIKYTLEFIKDIMDDFSFIVSKTIIYSQKLITEEEFDRYYDEFKIKFEKYKNKFDKEFKI